jgi:hypothetical protein
MEGTVPTALRTVPGIEDHLIVGNPGQEIHQLVVRHSVRPEEWRQIVFYIF